MLAGFRHSYRTFATRAFAMESHESVTGHADHITHNALGSQSLTGAVSLGTGLMIGTGILTLNGSNPMLSLCANQPT